MVTLVNRAKVATATTGTGTITLGAAESGYQSFSDAGLTGSDTVRYTIEDGDAWEIGTGGINAAVTTMSRTLIESSTGSKLILSGDAVVYVTAAGEDIQQPPSEGPFVDGDKTKLDGIEAGATADQTAGEIKTAYESNANTNTFTDAEQTKLAGIEATADVTDAGNVNPLVDAHLNTSSATSGEYLSWTGSDYDWVAVSGGATNLNELSDVTVLTGTEGGLSFVTSSSSAGSVFIGKSVGNSSSVFSTYIGAYLTGNGSSGNSNTVVGYSAGRRITGSNNIVLGDNAVGFSSINRTGSHNISMGYQSGNDLSSGGYNFLGGYQAGTNLTTGSNNVHIGRSAGDSTTTGANTIVIGANADASSATVSNEITLGNSSITRFRIPAAGIDNTSAALTGTTPSVDVGARDTYTLTTSGNTTFTFTGAPSSGQVGTFSLIITAGGTHTLTWPASVDWAGGTAPDAPASGEKDIYTFMTVDGGTTWYGFLAGDAMA